MANSIDYTTGEVVMNWNNPVKPGAIFAHYDLNNEEPSAVDRLAAIEDPDGETAKRVRRWEELEQLRKNTDWNVA